MHIINNTSTDLNYIILIYIRYVTNFIMMTSIYIYLVDSKLYRLFANNYIYLELWLHKGSLPYITM